MANWHDPAAVLLSTPHGSHLYGMAHAGSDRDVFVVHPGTRRRAKQTMRGRDDMVEMSFAFFCELAAAGSFQALEAMFSRKATIDAFPALRANFYAGGPALIDRYVRKARWFARQDKFKSRRHALRMLLNLQDIRRYGRFDPTLSAAQIALITEAAHAGETPSQRYLELFQTLAPYEQSFETF